MERPRRLPRYVQGFTDKTGKARWYFRRRGYPSVPLPGLPWSPGFMAAYEKALGGGKTEPTLKAGTFNALIVSYYRSGPYVGMRASTRGVYRNIIERFRAEHGDWPVNRIEAQHIDAMLAKRASTPAAANTFLKVMRALMRHAVRTKEIKADPTTTVERIPDRTPGFHTWTEGEIDKYEAHHKIGTRARLAFDLLLWTGQRRSDVVRMGRQHVRGGVIDVTQQKTGTRLVVPILPALRASLDAIPSDHLTFLTTAAGAAFSPAGFGNWFREMCRTAGLPERCSAHGLRKATGRRLAEAGCTAHEIMAVLGHRTLQEAERYTRAASQSRLAHSGMSRIDPGTKVSNLADRFVQSSENGNEIKAEK